MLSFSDITIQYSTQKNPLLSHITFDVIQGQRTVLLGANGSGKSSLLLCGLGFLLPSKGSITLDGTDMSDYKAAQQARRALGYVGQKPDDGIVATHVQDEVAFGPENLGLPRAELRERVDEALEKVGLSAYASREPHTLSGGQKQRLVIAGALAMHPRYLLLDEPCSMLDPAAREEVLTLIEQQREEGIGILHITHDLYEAQNADRILVFADGGMAFDGSFVELMEHEDKFEHWGIAAHIPPVERHAVVSDNNIFELKDVSVTYTQGNQEVHALDNVSCAIKQGELVVIEGHTGAGKSTLLKLLAGLMEPTSGSLAFDGALLTSKTTRGKVGLVFQNPEMALFGETVLQDVAFGPRNFGASEEESLAIARTALTRVGIDVEVFGERTPLKLSGGEARKVALAGVLAFEPAVLLTDEPTAALDAPSRFAVRSLLAQCSATSTVIVVTHSPEEFEGCADKIFTLRDGVLTERVTHACAHTHADPNNGEVEPCKCR